MGRATPAQLYIRLQPYAPRLQPYAPRMQPYAPRLFRLQLYVAPRAPRDVVPTVHSGHLNGGRAGLGVRAGLGGESWGWGESWA